MSKKISVLDLIDECRSEDNKRAYRSQTSQMRALSAVAIFYAYRIKWQPIATVTPNLRAELSDVSQLLEIDSTAHQTFIAHVRRMIHKLCLSTVDREAISRIQDADNGRVALKQLLEFLKSKNVFTAAHIRLWATTKELIPLDLTRKTGDAAKFRNKKL